MSKPAPTYEIYFALMEQYGITEPWVVKAVRSLRYKSNPILERKLTAFIQNYVQGIEQTERSVFLLPQYQDRLRGELSIGTIIGRPSVNCQLPIAPLNRHTLITGSAGSGKTILTLTLCEQALRGGVRGVRITDPKAYEFSVLAHKYPHILLLHVKELIFNMFAPPPGVTFEEWYSVIVNHLALSFNFWQGGEAMLLDAIYTLHKTGEVTLSKVYEFIERRKGGSSKDYIVKSTLLSRLRMLHYQFGSNIDRNSDLLEALSELPIIVIVEGLLSESESWFHEFLLLWDFHYRKHNPDKRFLTLRVFDECQHRVFNNQKEKTNQFGTATLISKLVDEARALNMGIVAVSQEPSSLLKAILNNSHTKFCLHLGSGQEIKIASEAMGLSREQTEQLHYLETGEAIVRTGTGYLDPYPVSIDLFNPQKRLSDNDFIDFQLALKNQLFKKTVSNPLQSVYPNTDFEQEEPHTSEKNKQAKPSQKSDETTMKQNKEDDIQALLSVWLNLPAPFLTQGQIMKKADIKSGSKQTQLKNQAVREALITIHKLQVGRTFTSIWEPTDKAFERCGLAKPVYASKGGYVHQFIAHHLKEWAKRKGHSATIEYQLSNGKAVDVAVDTGNGMDFFEIVVSKPFEKELTNIEKDFATDLQPKRFIFLVTDNKAKKVFEEMLTSADITQYIRDTIEVKLAGDFIQS